MSVMRPVWCFQKKPYKLRDTPRMKYTRTVQVETMTVNMLVAQHQHLTFPVPALFVAFAIVLFEISICSFRWRKPYNDLQFLGPSPPDERLSKH